MYLLTTNESSKLGVSDAIDPNTNQSVGKLTIAACGPTAWNVTGERDMFLQYARFLQKEFGDGQGVVIDHSWFGYPYFLITGGEILVDGARVPINPCPNLKLIHVIHGVTGWVKGNQYVPPPGVQYPRIMGVSKTHASYLSSCFKKPVRYVFNGVKIPDIGVGDKTSIDTYLLSLNRISKEKGIHNTIDVCLSTGNRLKIVGDDEHVSDQNYVWEIMDKCSRSGGLIEYVGLVDNDRKWDYIMDCRALITCPDPSNYVESFYMAAVEGWAAGRPILALSNGGLSDIVVDGVNGFLASNPDQMKQILVEGKEVYTNASPLSGMNDNGQSITLYERKMMKLDELKPDIIKQEAQKYSIENMAKGYLDICKGVMENSNAYLW